MGEGGAGATGVLAAEEGKRYTAIDLFCGAGGLTLGARMAGFRVLFGVDVDPWACQTYEANNPGVECYRVDIAALDPSKLRRKLGLEPSELDLLLGGPPCEGFSIYAPERYIEDPRNHLFRHYLAFVREFRPKFVLMENVPGMLSLGNGVFIRAIMRALEDLGYKTGMRVLNAANYGVPQDRWRVFIVGTALDGAEPLFPQPTHYAPVRANFTGGRVFTVSATQPDVFGALKRFVTVGEAIGDLPALRAGEGSEVMPYDREPHSEYARMMREGSKCVYNHVAPKLSKVNLERLKHIPPGGSWRDIPFDLLPLGMKRARRSDHTKRYGRLRADGLAATILGKCDPHWGPVFHYEQDRTLTVREEARLQSFPDWYRFYGPRSAQYEQVGNAVPPLLAKALCGLIRRQLSGDPIGEGNPVRAISFEEVEAFYEERASARQAAKVESPTKAELVFK